MADRKVHWNLILCTYEPRGKRLPKSPLKQRRKERDLKLHGVSTGFVARGHRQTTWQQAGQTAGVGKRATEKGIRLPASSWPLSISAAARPPHIWIQSAHGPVRAPSPRGTPFLKISHGNGQRFSGPVARGLPTSWECKGICRKKRRSVRLVPLCFLNKSRLTDLRGFSCHVLVVASGRSLKGLWPCKHHSDAGTANVSPQQSFLNIFIFESFKLISRLSSHSNGSSNQVWWECH